MMNQYDSGGSGNPEEKRVFVERRRKPDWVVRSVTVIAVLGWIGALIALVMIHRARPAGESFFTRTFDLVAVTRWDVAVLRSSFVAIMTSLVACGVGFIINLTRHRRKTDRYNKLLIILGVLSLALLIAFLIIYARFL